MALNRPDVVKVLLNHGAYARSNSNVFNFNDDDDLFVLCSAPDCLRVLLEHDPTVRVRDRFDERCEKSGGGSGVQ